jgi:hypothetical protein
MTENQIRLLIALIGFIGTVSAPVITLTVKSWHEQRQYPVPAEKRLNYLVGSWKGEFSQKDDKGDSIVTETTVTIDNEGRIIGGQAQFTSFAERPTRLRLYNGVYDGKLLKLEYENEQGHVFQKGSIIGEMTPYGDTINGKFVGYSPELGRIVNGEIKFSKEKTK